MPARAVLFYVASRGHHEDIGGLTPGSMTPRATTIEEEGVYIDNVKLVDGGRFLEDETRTLLTRARNIRRAVPTRTSPTSRRRSPPTPRARRS